MIITAEWWCERSGDVGMNKFTIALCSSGFATLGLSWHLLLLTDITIRDSEAIGLGCLAAYR